jgi:thiamine-monophosphate kinase
MRLRDLGEDQLIQRVRERLAAAGAGRALVIGVGEDAAGVYATPGRITLFTCDALVEEVHFRRRWMPARSLGWKALAINVSDIAAKGGLPSFALVTLSLPGELEVEFVDELYEGLIACGERYGCRVVGGDTVGSPGPISLSVALLGEVEPERLLRRSGAQVGDAILVTGELGGAGAGLGVLERGEEATGDDNARKRLLEPQPRLEAARWLAASGVVTAMMDLSDGLADDLPRLCSESGAGAVVFGERVPRHRAAEALAEERGKSRLEAAICGGEDYELLFTAPADRASRLARELEEKTGTAAGVIGEIAPQEQGVRFLDEQGRPLLRPEGYRHFG